MILNGKKLKSFQKTLYKIKKLLYNTHIDWNESEDQKTVDATVAQLVRAEDS